MFTFIIPMASVISIIRDTVSLWQVDTSFPGLHYNHSYFKFIAYVSPGDDPLSKDGNASQLLIFDSFSCDPVISYVTAIMTTKLLLSLLL